MKCFDGDKGMTREREEALSIYLSQPIWGLGPGGAGIFPNDGGSADPEILPGTSPPESSPWDIC